ncbi:jacalin-related lectin 3 [Malania oleifera]|uniref:jacalin-related lectin 3 n=1 Tax=Malania oleifera TaxID=397392 RepID=UPI0025AE4C06|nr:jacalin-related lectin 3 [Malania oleifera]
MSLEDYETNPVSVGPWGGKEGLHWNDGVHSTIRQLAIAHGAGINSIMIEYDNEGSSEWSEKHGGSGGYKNDTVVLDYPEEFLTSIHGYYGNTIDWESVFVRSLTFESNRRTYGPFGIDQGTHFSLPVKGGKIVGFHGRSGWNLAALGVYLKPHHHPNPSKALIHAQNCVANGRTQKLGYSVVQGSLGTAYDIVVAIRQKDDHGSNINRPLVNISRQTSQEFSYAQPKEKTVSFPSVERMVSEIDGPITYGPFGGNGGTIFDDGIHTGVRQINISRNVGIVSLRVLYDQDGQDAWGSKNGGTGGFKVDKIILDFPYEVLTHISGLYGPTMRMGPTIIKSLTFHTTKAKYGPYGEAHGTSFSTDISRGKVVGFHGRKGLFLDAIGVHVIEGEVLPPTRSLSNSSSSPIAEATLTEEKNQQWYNKLLAAKQGPIEEVSPKVIKEPALCGPGPWGGDGGKPWDDGVFSGVRQILLTKGEAICSIQIEYDRNGQSVWSVIHGGSGGTSRNQIKLECPNEVLICICGYYGPLRGDGRMSVVKSLTLYTSRGKYGPFGEEMGTFFTSTRTEGKVVGFHGRSSLYLDAIGVHMQHWLGSNRSVAAKPYSRLVKMFN